MNAIKLLREQFNSHVAVREKRPGVLQLIAPLFHEDGDMMDVFLNVPTNGATSLSQKIRVSDHGLTLMRLSYTFEIDTPNKDKIFRRILAENGVAEENGELFMDSTPESLYTALLQFSQAVSKVCNMRYFKREVLASLFEEMLAEFVQAQLPQFKPSEKILPIPSRDDLEVDWEFRPNGLPLYLFAIKDANRARLATISCLEFQRNNLKFKSIAVHEDIDRLGRKDRNRLTNACDKQFTSLEEFRQNGLPYLEREAH
ncbi:MAG TPA: DUF1828 domain-containing protein [Candidatus Limnocylindrales bacterium]|nr:DUF1828 domain-containing protein [Candidatus Limnocylindrales bacterium]